MNDVQRLVFSGMTPLLLPRMNPRLRKMFNMA